MLFGRTRLWLLLALLGSFVASHFHDSIDLYYADMLVVAGINIVLAVSLNLINGYTGQFSLGHAGFMAVGAYTAAALTMHTKPTFLQLIIGDRGQMLIWGLLIGFACVAALIGAYIARFVTGRWRLSPSVRVLVFVSSSLVIAGVAVMVGLHFMTRDWMVRILGAAAFGFVLLAGGAMAALAGFLVGAPSLRLRGDYLAIVTLGFGQIIAVILRNIPALGGALGLDQIPLTTDLGWVFAAAALAIYVVSTLVHSTYGRGFLAVSDDEVAAEAMGVNTTRYKVVAFVIGAFFAGIAGGLDAHFNTTINPKGYDFNRSIEIVAMVILGGMGSTRGVVVAAFLLTVANYKLSALKEYRPLLYAGLLIAMMLLRPQGLFAFGGKRKAQL